MAFSLRLPSMLTTFAVAFAFLFAGAAWAGDAAQGKIKAHMCLGCHNITNYLTAFPTVYHVPRIQGQSESYIVYALKEYASGARYSPKLNRLASMPAIAGSLTERDMEDLAAYYSSLGDE